MQKNEPHRCAWARKELEKRYHDLEWGVPTRDDQHLYEMLLLEAFQAGLSWYVVLKKREAFRSAFDGFDARKIAEYDESKIEALLQDEGIIRSRRKIVGAIANARCFLDTQKEFGTFADYLYHFSNYQIITNTTDEFVTRSELSDRMAADMKKRGFHYMGSITVYSYLQAIGLINDHETACMCYHQPKLL